MASKLTTVSVRDMIEALIAGERNPHVASITTWVTPRLRRSAAMCWSTP